MEGESDAIEFGSIPDRARLSPFDTTEADLVLLLDVDAGPPTYDTGAMEDLRERVDARVETVKVRGVLDVRGLSGDFGAGSFAALASPDSCEALRMEMLA